MLETKNSASGFISHKKLCIIYNQNICSEGLCQAFLFGWRCNKHFAKGQKNSEAISFAFISSKKWTIKTCVDSALKAVQGNIKSNNFAVLGWNEEDKKIFWIFLTFTKRSWLCTICCLTVLLPLPQQLGSYSTPTFAFPFWYLNR